MKPRLFLLFVLLLLSPLVAEGAKFRLLYRTDPPRPAKWRAVDAKWIDDERIVICPTDDVVSCVETATGKLVWTRKLTPDDSTLLVSRGSQRVARRERYGSFAVFDARSGELIFDSDDAPWEELLGERHVRPSLKAIHPIDGRLLVVEPGLKYGLHAHLLDASISRIERTYGIDALSSDVSFSPNGKRFSVIAHGDVRCVTDLDSGKDVYLVGPRRLDESESLVFTIDAPFCSSLSHDGDDRIVYAIDNSWATGTVFIHTISTRETIKFGSRNGHVVLDVDWQSQRIALGGTSKDLTLLDFDGKELAELKNAVDSRIMSIEFSPSKRQVLLTDQNMIATIFEIVD